MKHFIAKKKLLKAHLSEKQIEKVYSLKTKKEQLSAAKRMVSSVKATRTKKFYRTGLGRYMLRKQRNKLIKFQHSEEFKKLSEKQQKKVLKKIDIKKIQWERSIIRITKVPQAKEDLKFKLEKLKARINAGEYTYSQRTTQESYDYNGTLNTNIVDYVLTHYWLDFAEEREKGELDEDTIIQNLFKKAIKDGDIKELAQGAGFGYIDVDNKEVISPV